MNSLFILECIVVAVYGYQTQNLQLTLLTVIFIKVWTPAVV